MKRKHFNTAETQVRAHLGLKILAIYIYLLFILSLYNIYNLVSKLGDVRELRYSLEQTSLVIRKLFSC